MQSSIRSASISFHTEDDSRDTSPPGYLSRQPSLSASRAHKADGATGSRRQTALRPLGEGSIQGDDTYEDQAWRREAQQRESATQDYKRYPTYVPSTAATPSIAGHSEAATTQATTLPDRQRSPLLRPAAQPPLPQMTLVDEAAAPADGTRRTHSGRKLCYGIGGVLLLAGAAVGGYFGKRAADANDQGASGSPTTTLGGAGPTRTMTRTASSASPTATYAGLLAGTYRASGAQVFDNCTRSGFNFDCAISTNFNLHFTGTTNDYQVQQLDNGQMLAAAPQTDNKKLDLFSPFIPVTGASGCSFREQVAYNIDFTDANRAGFTHTTTLIVSNNYTGFCADVAARPQQLGDIFCKCEYIGGSSVVG